MWWDRYLEQFYREEISDDAEQAEAFAEAFNRFLEDRDLSIADLSQYHYLG